MEKRLTHYAQKFREHFSIFSKFSTCGTWFPDFSDFSPKKCVLGPGDVFGCFPCPLFYRFVHHIENVPQTLSDAPQKLIVYMCLSIWHWPFKKTFLKTSKYLRKGYRENPFFSIALPIELPIDSAWNH